MRRVVLTSAAVLTAASAATAGGPSPPLLLEDVSAATGVEREGAGQYGPMWGDLDGDGWPDLLFTNHGSRPSLLRNDQGTTFVDRLEESGIRTRGWIYDEQNDRHGAACADYDGDGDVDVLIAHGAKKGLTVGVKYDELLRNAGPMRFEELSHHTGLVNSIGRARVPTWVDYDRDGLIDVYLGNYASPNLIYRNRGDGTFEERTRSSALGLEQPVHPAWADFDRDGYADVALAPPLTLMRNLGNGAFEDVTEGVGIGPVLAGTAFSLAWGDVDGDGDPDLFSVSRRRDHTLWINDDGRFHRRLGEAFEVEEGDIGQGAVWGDLDGDGWLDLVVVGSRRLHFFHNVDGRLEQWPTAASVEIVPGEGGDAALADFDRDGRLDVAVAAAGSHHLLRGTGAERAWLSLHLQGRAGNRTALGSEVVLTTAAGRQVRQYFGDSGVYRAVDCTPLHVGLGDAHRVDVEVLWPTGRRSRTLGLPTSRGVALREP